MNAILKKISLMTIASALTVGFAGCADDDADSVSSSQQNIILEQNDAHRAFEIRSNTAWTAECIGLNDDGMETEEPWFMLTPSSGLGTRQVALDVLSSNHTATARKGRIVVTYANGQTYPIEVMQRGLTHIECSVTPEQIGLAAAASTGNFFTVSVANRDADITVALKTAETADAPWIKNLAKSHDLSYGYSRKETWAFDVEDNTMSDARTAEIEVTVRFGYNTYKYTVTVTQNGLGAPAVKTAPAVYMNCGQTAHRQTIWLEGGNTANVQYDVTWTSAYQGVGNTGGWITKAEIIGSELVVTADPNTDDNAREGSVLIVAHRPGAADEGLYATLSVQVVQAGHKAAGIVMPVSEIAHGYAAANYSLQMTLLNGSTVKSIISNNLMFATISTYDDGRLTYRLEQYDGSQGDYREGVITVQVSNGNSNDAIASLTIRQYAPEMPAISMPVNTLTCDYTAATREFPLNTLNASELSLAGTNADWITASVDAGKLTYALTEYDGSLGDFREGVVTISASNAHADKAYYYITIRQYTPRMPEFSLPDYIGAGFEAQNFVLPVDLQGGTLTVVSSPAWAPTTYADNQITVAFSANSGTSATNYMREGIVTLKYSKGGLSAYYYLQLHQYARDMAYLTTGAINWSWYAHCNGFNSIIGYGRYVPGQVSQVVSIQNLPHVHEITVSRSNNQFTATLAAADITVTPYSWELGNPDWVTRLTTTISVFITGAPYSQILTFQAAAVQTSGHDPVD